MSAMKGRLGDTEYYVLTMKAQELISKVKIPKEIPEWEHMSIEERYQRDIKYARVKTHIAPYLANDESRFFGALIVTATNFGDRVTFEPLSDVTTKGLPALYRTAATGMGFLTFGGGELLVPLDGQHRLKAIEFAITGRDEKGKDIPRIGTPCLDLAEEDVTVILVPFQPEKARRIFTKVNRYAKSTTTGENIVTEDDDMAAVLARDIANRYMNARLAKWQTNTLNKSDGHFTTLAIVYSSTREIITRSFFERGRPDTTKLPDPAKQKLWREKVEQVWKEVLEGIDVFADALDDPEASGDEKRKEIRDTNLLGKPVTQECLINAYLSLTAHPTNMSPSAACDALNRLPWEMTKENLREVWQNVLWTGGKKGRIITKNRGISSRLIAYLAGERLLPKQEERLTEDYNALFPDTEDGKELPPRIVEPA